MASKSVFADTSFFFALVAKRDPAHHAAVDAYAKLLRAGAQLFTTDYVVDETLTLTKARINAQTAITLLDRIEASEAVAMEDIAPERFVSAKTYFRKHANHGYFLYRLHEFRADARAQNHRGADDGPPFQRSGI